MAVADYRFPWDRLIARFKFQGETAWARTFAGLMRDAPGAGALLDAAASGQSVTCPVSTP